MVRKIRAFLEKAIVTDRETLDELYHKDWTSIGVVEIEFIDFFMQTQKKHWERDKPYIKQFHLYTQLKPLEQLPIEMRLKFRCKNNPTCKTHESALIGWQYMEAFGKGRKKYGSGQGAFDAIDKKIRLSTQRSEQEEICVNGNSPSIRFLDGC